MTRFSTEGRGFRLWRYRIISPLTIEEGNTSKALMTLFSQKAKGRIWPQLFFFFTLVTGPRRSLRLKLSDTKVYEPQIRARFGNHNTTILGFCRNSLWPQLSCMCRVRSTAGRVHNLSEVREYDGQRKALQRRAGTSTNLLAAAYIIMSPFRLIIMGPFRCTSTQRTTSWWRCRRTSGSRARTSGTLKLNPKPSSPIPKL